MKLPIAQALQEYIRKDLSRFHMPGHKGRGEGILKEIYPYDITEVTGMDSLYQGSGPIAACEENFRRIYGTKQSLLSAGGATLCIQTMLALVCGLNSKVIISRNVHLSAVHTMAHLNLTPVWLTPEMDAGEWFLGRYSAASVEKALKENLDAAGVYSTTPDYFGVMSDVEEIAQVCKKYGTPLMIDNAHGAHLKFYPAQQYGRMHPMDCGADLCADSLHKTLPVLTGGALLHINNARFIRDARQRMSMFGSTSPSFPILLSCDLGSQYAAQQAAAEFCRTAEILDSIRRQAADQGFLLPRGKCDPAKLTLGFGALGYTPQTFLAHLHAFGIEPEYVSGSACVFMASGYNTEKDFSRVREMIRRTKKQPDYIPPSRFPLYFGEQVMSIREAEFSPHEEILVENCEGRIAAGVICPCPPGIPVVVSGEKLNKDSIKMLKNYGAVKVNVVK